MALDWIGLRARLVRAQRDAGGRCSVIVTLRSGTRLSAQVTEVASPGGWPENEVHLCHETRNGGTTVTVIDVGEIAALAYTP